MNTFSPLCTYWQQQVKDFFQELHGHQSKTLAFFVLGAIRAESVVIPKVAEALLAESEAKAPSIERRLQRFLSNSSIQPEKVWDSLLQVVLPAFQNEPMRFVIDLTNYEEHAQLIYIGLIVHSRVLPVAWKVMPGQKKWDQGLWDAIEQLFQRIEPYIKNTDYTLIGDSAFGCYPMVYLCKKYGWHYLFRICEQHTCKSWSAEGQLLPACAVSTLVSAPGKRFSGAVQLWQEHSIETNVSGYWDKRYDEPLLVISDRPAGNIRIKEYKKRWKVESTFEDMKSRGWDWEESHVRRLDRVDRLLLVLFLLLWWMAHLAAACIRQGKRDRYDRHDRRDKNIFRLGRLYLLDIERRNSTGTNVGNLVQCLLFRGKPHQWTFSIQF